MAASTTVKIPSTIATIIDWFVLIIKNGGGTPEHVVVLDCDSNSSVILVGVSGWDGIVYGT